MGQKKLKRFNEIRSFKNVLEKPEGMNGQWSKFFNNDNPIIVELACGKGEYTVGLAAMHPGSNFIGVDIKGNRMWAGAKIALEKNYANAAFLRTHIDKIDEYFNKDEVSEIWITFPDPQLRRSRSKKRLTHPHYLNRYHQILKDQGLVHLKTDSPALYEFTKDAILHFELKIIEDSDNVYQNKFVSPELQIKTYYEKLDIAQSNRIFYICFQLSDKLGNHDLLSLFNDKYKTLETETKDESETN